MGRRMFAWIGWILVSLALYFFENNTGTRAVLVISLLVPLFSAGCAYMTARQLTVSLDAPGSVRAGEKIRCAAAVRSSAWRAGCSVICAVSGRNTLTGEQSGAELPVSFGGSCVFETVSSRCGRILLTAEKAEVRDWFGIWRFRRDAGAEASVLVEPTLYPVSVGTDPDAGSSSREAGGSRRRPEDPEPGDLRTYLPGDSIRRIHWKLSEKTDRTLIRESAPEAMDMAALMLETAFPDGEDPEAIHAAAQGLLSVSRALTAEGIIHTVISEKNGSAVRTDIADETGFRRAEEQVLTSGSRTGGTGIGTLFRLQYPDVYFRRVILFSPHPAGGAASLAEYQPVTLVLPPFAVFAGTEAGIRTILLHPENARIDI